MNLLEIICKELGVEIGEKWEGNDGFEHIIYVDGRIEWFEPGWGWKRLGTYEDILTGKLKPVWKPKMDERYFIPDILNSDLYRYYIWDNGPADKRWQNLGIVFKTKEEAIVAANKMINALKED